MLQHPTLDEYWRRVLLTERDFSRIDLPALHVTGWFDSSQAGAMHYWHGMVAHSPAAAHQYLIVGPWDHAQTYFGGARRVGEMEFTSDAVLDPCQVHLVFFESYLKQATPRFDHPRARLYVTGRNEWQAFDAYPIASAMPHTLYLSSGGRANTASGDGKLLAASVRDEPPDHYEFDPKNPVPVDPFKLGSVYGVDRREVERRADVLVYTGEPLGADIEVIGRLHVELYAASDALDTDFTASILDVHPDGRAVVLGARVSGIIRARYRYSLERMELLTPGRIEKYRIDLGHLAHAFKAGHRVRVEISSSAAPLYNPNQNTGNAVATDTDWRTARQTIYHDAEHPSALVLPVKRT
jgi:putative CocE/NonD family hydrolase